MQDVAATDEQPRGQQNIAKRGTGIKATNLEFKCDQMLLIRDFSNQTCYPKIA